MVRIRSICSAALTLAVIPFITPSALGQEPAVGERIRVRTTSEPSQVVGVLETRQPDYLVVQTTESGPMNIAWADISRLQVSRGTKSNAGKGALIGAGLGLAGTTALVIGGCAGDDTDCGEDGGFIFAAYLLFTGGAALVGTFIGAIVRTERWVDVPGDRWQIEVAPDPNGGVAVGLNLRL